MLLEGALSELCQISFLALPRTVCQGCDDALSGLGPPTSIVLKTAFQYGLGSFSQITLASVKLTALIKTKSDPFLHILILLSPIV